MEGVRGHHRPIDNAEPKPKKLKPHMPEWLDEAGRKQWRKTMPMLFRLGLVTEADGESLGAYCAAIASLASSSMALQNAQGVYELTAPETSQVYNQDTGEVITLQGHDKVKAATVQFFKALQTVTRLSAEFGLTPSARTRIQVAPQDPDNPTGGIR